MLISKQVLIQQVENNYTYILYTETIKFSQYFAVLVLNAKHQVTRTIYAYKVCISTTFMQASHCPDIDTRWKHE